ncbi:TIGR00341 family protein [Candidatus Parcubacteria bacterium]|jgi:uncharacterized hydrophobic protein (TIGR00271 family)|nr:TIGR00341 family protein [Candidatus Parcubacteria bacterium]MBT3949348.1 TIGR00341 family protein [Candidatus Parcubacteria bacterium]
MFNFLSSAARIRNKTERHLEQYSRPSVDFFILITLSAPIIAIGLILNNAAIIIGGMVVAPLITPFFGFSLNIMLFRIKGIFKSFISILFGSILAIAVSALTGYIAILLYNERFILTSEILTRAKPDFLYFIVALLSGLVGAYAYARPKLSERVIGIAISAAIVPPLSVIGLGIALLDKQLANSSLFLFIINFVGICLGSIFMFIILGFGKEIEKPE